MSVKSVNVNIVTSIDSFLALVNGIVLDVKAGKPSGTVVSDAAALLVAALGEISQVGSDVLNRTDVENTVALRLVNLVDILAPITTAPVAE